MSLSAIYVGLAQLRIGADDKRDLYRRVTRKDSLKAMTPSEQNAVLAELRRLGFKPASKDKKGRRHLSGRYAGKLQALWIAAWNLGLVNDRNDSALEAFVKRQTGLSSERFLRFPEDAAKVIEALKSWMTREAGIDWSRAPLDWMISDQAKIAWAQWKKLQPGADLVNRKGFDEAVKAHARVTGMLSSLTPQDWIEVMNAFGSRIRPSKKKAAAA